MKHSRFHITDHVMLRYLERVHGVDMAAIRAEISGRVEAAEDHPTCSGVISDGFVYKLSGDTVTTIVPAARPDNRTKRGRWK